MIFIYEGYANYTLMRFVIFGEKIGVAFYLVYNSKTNSLQRKKILLSDP